MKSDRGSAERPDEQDETGSPIRALTEQEMETGPDFVAKVRNKIYRRTATSQVASFSWHLPKMILLEAAGMLEHFCKSFGMGKGS
jgi:hypothetical protein